MKNVYLASLNPMHFSHRNTFLEAERQLNQKVFLCICQNALKDGGLFTLEERVEIAHKFYGIPREQIIMLSKKEEIISVIKNSTKIIRGIRSEKDLVEVKKLVEHYGVSEDFKKVLFINVPDSMKLISSSLLISKIKLDTYSLAENWVPDQLICLIKEKLNIKKLPSE